MAGVQYVSLGSAQVGYEVHGEGDLDIVYCPGLASHLDLTIEQPRYRHFVERLTQFGRVIRFDRRGTGVSDPVPADAGESWELWADDLAAVLDDAGSTRVAVIATNDAGPAGILFTAMQPERVQALVLFNTTACFEQAPGYPMGYTPDVGHFVADVVRGAWGKEESVAFLAPSQAADEPFCRWYARFQRAACSPSAMADSMERLFRMDVRHTLGELHCPTLVLHRAAYNLIGPEHAHYMVEQIADAEYYELPGADAPIYTEALDEAVDRIGVLLGRTPMPEVDDRRFTTVLFTDIVASTERAVVLGDHEWDRLLSAHDRSVRGDIDHHGGRVIKTTGDGVLATFDAPSRAIACSHAIHRHVGDLGIEVRVGLHAGPVVQRPDGDISGIAVNTAARVLGQAGPGEVLVSGSIVGLVTSDDVRFDERGEHRLKGIPEPQRLYACTADEEPAAAPA